MADIDAVMAVIVENYLITESSSKCRSGWAIEKSKSNLLTSSMGIGYASMGQAIHLESFKYLDPLIKKNTMKHSNYNPNLRLRLFLQVCAILVFVVNHAMAAPSSLVQTITYNNETITMRLTKEDLRGANFELWSQNSSGGYDVVTPVAERSYIGTVDEYPGAISCGILQDDGQFRGVVYFDRASQWFTHANAVTGTRGGPEKPYVYAYPDFNVTPGSIGTNMYGFDVGVDARYSYYANKAGSSVAKTFELVEFSVAVTRAIYMRDALLRPYLGRIIIRTSQSQEPYDGLGGGTYLDALKTEWESNHTSANRDVVCGVASNEVGGGLAWVGVIGGSSAYSVNDSAGDGDFSAVWRHELGHNWGCGHYDGGQPELRTIMSNNQYGRFSCGELKVILDERDEKIAFLDNLGVYTAVNLHPYTCLDDVRFKVGVDTQVTVDVLANDHDGNGHALTLSTFDSYSNLGGAVTLSAGTGPNGRDELLYSAPGSLTSGFDYFSYTVVDSSGQTQTGIVVVDIVQANRAQIYWALDETTGTTAFDQTAFQRDGAALGGLDLSADNVAGKYGTAIHFDGVDDSIETTNLPSDLSSYTIGLWVKPDSTGQATYTSVLNNNSSGSDFQLEADGTTYEYNGIGGAGTFGTITTDWVHLAITCDGANTRLFYNGSFVTSIAAADNDFGALIIGANRSSDKHFSGSIDEVRLYDYQLSDSAVTDLYNGDIGAESPTPFDGAGNVKPSGSLSWLASPTAVQYHVYFGLDQTAVQNATTAQPEYQGATTGASYSMPATQELTTYYLRVDTETSSGTVTGAVWSFTTSQNPVVMMETDFDGATAAGTQLSGVTWTQDASMSSSVSPSGTVTSLETHSLRNDLSQWANNVAVDYNLNTDSSVQRGIISTFSVSGAPVELSEIVVGHTHTNSSGGFQVYSSDMTVTLTDTSDGSTLWTDTTNYSYSSQWKTSTYDVGAVQLQPGKTYTVSLSMNNLSGGGAYASWNQVKLMGVASAIANAAPVANDSIFAVAEDVTIGTSVGTVSATDSDTGDTLNYAITAGNGWGKFVINSSTGEITTTAALDYETASQYLLTVTVTDDGIPSLTDTASVTIDVTDVNEAPVANDTSGSIAEDVGVGSAVLTVSFSDVDAGDTLSFAITAGNTGGAFSINNNGNITTASALDYETTTQYVLTVTVTDDGNPALDDTATVTVDVTNVNEAPVASDTSGSVAEKAAAGAAVATVAASDVDAGDSLSYAITAGNTGNAFAIDSSGNITTTTPLDYETLSIYTLTVTVTDSGLLTDTAIVGVTVTDVVETTAPVVSTGAASAITQTGADIAYTVSDDGGEAPTVTVYYGTSDGGSTPGNWDSSAGQGAKAIGGHSASLSGLTEGTTYYFSVHASNSAGEAWGSTGSFTTGADTSPKLVRTTVSGVGNGSWTTVNLGQSYSSPVIIATPIYPNTTTPPVVTRITNINGGSFDLKIDRADGLTDAMTIDVSIIAVEEGVYTQANDGVTMEAVKYTSTVTSENNSWVGESRTYQNSYTAPVVVGQVMSANDANWSVFYSMGGSRTAPASASVLNVGKHVGEDPNTTRANETVGYIVIESGSGTINGVAYEAALGADTVRGFGNSSNPYTYTLTGGLSTASAAAASISGMDGNNGAWAVLSGSPALTTTSIGLHALEDQMNDSEQSHATTQVGYIVFE